MKKMTSGFLISLLSLCFFLATPACSTPVTSLSDAAWSEAWVLNFGSRTTGEPILWTIGDAAFRTTDNNFTVDSQYAGQYINSAPSMRSETCEVRRFSGHTISFPDGTGASGSTWGVSDYRAEIRAYNFGNNLLDTCQLPATNAANAGKFVGTAFTTKGYDYLMAASDNYNWMFTVLTLYGCDVATGAFRKTC